MSAVGTQAALTARRLEKAARYLEAGRFRRAARACERVLHDDPQNALALGLLGSARFYAGQQQAGLDLVETALQAQPQQAHLLATLGTLLAARNDFATAVNRLREAVLLEPERLDFKITLADTLMNAGSPREAGALYREILQQQPGHIGVRLNLALCLQAYAPPAEVTRELEQTLQLAPDSPEAVGMLAQWYEELNQIEAAAGLALTALGRWPDEPRLALVASRCYRRQGQLEQALDLTRHRPGLAWLPGDRMALAYERAKILDQLDRPADAIAAAAQANKLWRQSWQARHPGPNQYAGKVTRLLETFTSELVRDWPGKPQSALDHQPVFLVGFPRSGTTLLQRLLVCHPQVRLMEERGVIAVLEHELAVQGAFPQVLAQLGASELDGLRDRYFELAGQQTSLAAGQVLVDKLPLNLVNAGLIQRVFPGARFIFALRHPADACLSCLMQNFQFNDAMANFTDLASTTRFYSAVLALWHRYRELLPLAVQTVRYEDLVDDLQQEASSMLQFIGLEWHESMREFHRRREPQERINTPSYEQVSQPLYRSARYRWRRYRQALEPELPTLEPWIDALGYSLAN